MPRSLTLGAALALALTLTACDASQQELAAPAAASASAQSETEAAFVALLDDTNAALAAADAPFRAGVVEWVGGPDEMGGTIIARDLGNRQLDGDFVPFDERRTWGDPAGGITYAIDETTDAVPLAGGLTQPETDAAIERATQSWEEASCSTLPLTRVDTSDDLGIVAGNALAADVQHAGWRDLEFGGGTIGATFSFFFCAPCGADPVFTDIDNNRKLDTAFREIYYDPFAGAFGPPRVWSDDGVSNIDVETVALHEIGHGLSQAHFGTVRITRNNRLQFSPRAVMNAVYAGPFQSLAGTDNAGHCSLWANWPQG